MREEEIQFHGAGIAAITPGERWRPCIGPEAQRFLGTLPAGLGGPVGTDAIAILARGTPPGQQGRIAGLVVGYVQSGKTTSFTAAAAVAGDNGYAAIVVLGGTSANLLQQTRDRLTKDLALDAKDAYRRWIHLDSPRPGSPEANQFRSALQDYLDPTTPATERAPVLVTLMKQHVHMSNFAQVLESMARDLDLSGVSALIIDDEADQATPNLRRVGDSATYGRLRRIRAALPSHTLLQYTATPQAPLLVSIADEISPEFVCVLEPGVGYTGGRHFFVEREGTFFRPIPMKDLLSIDDEATDPPGSLTEAFAAFIVGCASSRALGVYEPPQRSMLVHPSHKTLPHERFQTWLEAAREHWLQILCLPVSDPDRQALVADVLAPARAELLASVSSVPSIEELAPGIIRVLRKLSIKTVNATEGSNSSIKFSGSPYWILIGGTLLDRGFTVEGLTVTYMPRPVGVGNADTLQQRARFFGYKASYAGYCRAWLDPAVRDAFTKYVRHEEALRAELLAVARAGRSLKDWKRVFFLDKALKPTRQSVVRLQLFEPAIKDDWFSQGAFGDVDEVLIASNRRCVDQFLSGLTLVADPRSGPTAAQSHSSVEVPLGRIADELLSNFVMFGSDSGPFTALRALLSSLAEEPEIQCRVTVMGTGLGQGRRRRRALDRDSSKIKNLFQGRNPRTGPAEYEGDRRIHGESVVTVQIHRVDLATDDGTEDGAAVLIADVPILAIWTPGTMRERVLMEGDR